MAIAQLIAICIFSYLIMFAFSILIFYEEYYSEKITLFENLVLAAFWPITVPYKLIKTFIKAIKKI